MHSDGALNVNQFYRLLNLSTVCWRDDGEFAVCRSWNLEVQNFKDAKPEEDKHSSINTSLRSEMQPNVCGHFAVHLPGLLISVCPITIEHFFDVHHFSLFREILSFFLFQKKYHQSNSHKSSSLNLQTTINLVYLLDSDADVQASGLRPLSNGLQDDFNFGCVFVVVLKLFGNL